MPTNTELFERIIPALKEQLVKRLSSINGYRSLSPERRQQAGDNAIDHIAKHIEAADFSEFNVFWTNIARERLDQGFPLNSIMTAIRVLDEEISTVSATIIDDTKELLQVTQRAHVLIQSAISAVFDIYERAYNGLLEAQQSALREISTPIVPIYEGILVLPMIGAIDSNRATTVTEALLEAITEHQADVVIMDITGVPVIDTGIANYLIQAARAVRLLGSQVVLVGISAEIAQTIVQLGIDLTGIVTRSNLQSGIEFALGLLDLAIYPKSNLE